MDLSVTALVIATVVGFGLPPLSALISRYEYPPEVAGLVTVGTSVVTGFAAQLIAEGSHVDWKGALATAGTTYLAAAQSRARIWVGSVTDQKLSTVGSAYPPIADTDDLIEPVKDSLPDDTDPNQALDGEDMERIEGVPESEMVIDRKIE